MWILAWVLVMIPHDAGGNIVYSPPMQDLQSCQRVMEVAKDVGYRKNCVQINTWVSK